MLDPPYAGDRRIALVRARSPAHATAGSGAPAEASAGPADRPPVGERLFGWRVGPAGADRRGERINPARRARHHFGDRRAHDRRDPALRLVVSRIQYARAL